MDNPTWDSITTTWDLTQGTFDAPLVADDTFTPSKHRTVQIAGEEAKRVEMVKDPDARLDYTWDFTQWLADANDTLVSGEFVVPDVLTVSAITVTATKATAWVAGGAGVLSTQLAKVQCRVVTAAGRVDDRCIYIRVEER